MLNNVGGADKLWAVMLYAKQVEAYDIRW